MSSLYLKEKTIERILRQGYRPRALDGDGGKWTETEEIIFLRIVSTCMGGIN